MVEQHRLELYEATIRSIITTMREYLPPKSEVTPRQFVRRVIEVVDTPEICLALGIK